MVVSFTPGRVRLRFRELKNSAAAESAKVRIAETPGVTAVDINPRTGSILIEYDPAILPAETLTALGKEALAKFNIKLDIPVA